MERGRRHLVAGVLIVAIGCMGVAIAMGASSTKRVHTHRTGRWRAGSQGKRVGWAKKHFLLLNHSPDVIPLAVRLRLDRGRYARPWRLARNLPESHRGQFWLIPEKTQLCIIAWTPEALGEVCSSRKRAIKNGIALVTLPAHSVGPLQGARFLIGVAPMGIQIACVHDGQDSRLLPVTATGIFSLSDWKKSPPTNVTMGPRKCPNSHG